MVIAISTHFTIERIMNFILQPWQFFVVILVGLASVWTRPTATACGQSAAYETRGWRQSYDAGYKRIQSVTETQLTSRAGR